MAGADTTALERGAPSRLSRAAFPTEEAARIAVSHGRLIRAIEAYRFFYPTVSMEGMLQGIEDAGARPTRDFIAMSATPRQRVFTASSDAPYAGAVLDLSSGPVVIEVPAGPCLGLVNDRYQRWVQDLGLTGPDGGRAGRFLLLPPESPLFAEPGHHVSRVASRLALLSMHAIPEGRDLDTARRRLRQLRVYPFAERARPAPNLFIDVTSTELDGTCLAWEDNLGFWEVLHGVIDSEPVVPEFRPMYGVLAVLGIERGKPFRPSQDDQLLLERAALLGRQAMLVEAFASQRPDRVVWPDRKWEWVALRPNSAHFDADSYLDIQARERWFIQALSAGPAMFRRDTDHGSLIWLCNRDANDVYLDGGACYELNVPAPVPARLFWSVTAYDVETRTEIRTDRNRAALCSLSDELEPNADGSVDLFFGPEAPACGATRWIKTLPGRGWFVYLRLYGPEAGALDGGWKPGDFNPLE